jgi:hypothetical protein
MRILVAIEPLSYREIVAFVLSEHRHEAEVMVAAAKELDDKVVDFAPHLIVCEELTPKVQARASSWVRLLPPGRRDAAMRVGDQHTRILNMGIEDLLRVVDAAKEMISDLPMGSLGTSK